MCYNDISVQAHGLANHCAVKDSTEERRQLVYQIEKSWYKNSSLQKDKHPLTYSEHLELTNSHKLLLENFRKETSTKFDRLEVEGGCLDANDIFSDPNICRALKFSRNVFAANEKSTTHFLEVSQQIVASSVEILRNSGEKAPCDFAVIGLGSVARGEATPYSDLEYAFIVAKKSEYFTWLAMDTYFRIGNIGESPLKLFDISELKVEKGAVPILTDDITVGYRIDGITSQAGNIPTGHGSEGQSLTLTVEGLMKLYKKEAEAPFDKKTWR